MLLCQRVFAAKTSRVEISTPGQVVWRVPRGKVFPRLVLPWQIPREIFCMNISVGTLNGLLGIVGSVCLPIPPPA